MQLSFYDSLFKIILLSCPPKKLLSRSGPALQHDQSHKVTHQYDYETANIILEGFINSLKGMKRDGQLK